MTWWFAYSAIGKCIQVGMLLAVLRRNFAPGASIAWLAVVFLHPYIGLALYLVFGESRLGPGRVVHHNQLLERYAVKDLLLAVSAEDQPLVNLAMKVGQMPVVPRSGVEFFTDSAVMVNRLAADIAAATSHVHLLYYILASDSTGQQIAEALKGAAQKGVKCRVIVDQLASRSDFGRDGFASKLESAGVKVVAALPSSLLRRRDLRNHRKLAVIDDRVAYGGSQNLINPDYGGKRGGPWVDLSGRFTGPVVGEFATVFVSDWAFETNEELDAPAPATIAAVEGGTAMQVVPTGPVSPRESFRRLLLGIINSAQSRLVLTTPYFVPDQATLLALLTAADRGVDVQLIVPEKSDNILAAAASQANYTALLEGGVSIFEYRSGLIHSKAITVDDRVAVFGSANLDIRSFSLNFEVTTLLYGKDAAERLWEVQRGYIASSKKVDAKEWAERAVVLRYWDAGVSLISPLL